MERDAIEGYQDYPAKSGSQPPTRRSAFDRLLRWNACSHNPLVPRLLDRFQASVTIGDGRSLGCVMVFSLKRGRPSLISNHGSLELTHWWKVGRTRAGSSRRPMAMDSKSRSPISKQTPPRQDAQIMP